MAAINVSVGGDTRQLDRDIQRTVNKAYKINLKTKGEQPLGRITGQVNEFNKSLEASNARVIAFGASAGIIFGVERAFSALVSTTIEVQKSLQDINVILNVSSSQLNKFGADLFNIAKNTGQSFQEVAKAATEFSRQGLGVEETLKRTNQALVLSRLSGLDAAKSVEALTAAVNSYAAQAVTASEVVNKFANVDAAFAVSSADLAEALARVGSSAAQSGVSLNELIAIVTSAQQTTARGGSVIGNSFKTIFTRLQRTKVVNLLEGLGVDTKDSSGQIKSTISLLQDLAKTYDQLGTLQQAEVAEKVGGVFQINILKAALADLGKEYSIYNNALNVAASTTDQAIRRNEELNKTYAAQLNALKENAKQLGATAGQRLIGPTFERVVGGANKFLGGVNESDGNSFGATLGKGVLDGLGQVIAGPGLVLLGGIFAKLFGDLSKFAVGSAKDFLGLNNAAKQQAELQRSITEILSRNPALIQQMGQGTAGVNKLAETLLATLRAQTIELQKQQQVGAQVASILAKSGVRIRDGVPIAAATGKPGKAAGYIPNFAATGGVSKRDAFAETVAAYQAGYEPGPVSRVDNKVYNKAESVVKFPGAKDRGIVPPKDSPAGEQYQKDFKKTAGYDPYAYMETGMAKGFVPNFAYAYKMKTFAASRFSGKGVENPRAEKQFNKFFNKGGFPNVEIDDKISTVGFEIEPIPLTPKLQKLYDTQPGSPAFTKDFEKYAINQLKFTNAGKPGRGNVKLYGGPSSAVDGYRISNGLAEFLEVKGGGFETLAVANKFGRVLPENLARFTQSKLGIQYLNALFKEGVPERKDTIKLKNTLAVPKVPKARKGNFNRPFKVADIEANRLKNAGRAQGFIPNFAKASKAGTVDLGDISSNPSYKGKLISVIIPQPTKNLLKFPAQAKYTNTTYTTTGFPVSGPNRDVTKKLSQQNIPNLHKNIGKVVLDQANVFGQSLGATKFISSVSQLPNLGGVNSAAGVAFEGGVANALGQSVGSKNARIDFTSKSLNSQIKRIFNNAPGSYEAKNRPSPELINDGFSKFLRGVKPGSIKSPKSGGFKEAQGLRDEALKILRSTGKPYTKKQITDQIDLLRRQRTMASGFIPNFSATSEAEKRALKTENMMGGRGVLDYEKGLGPYVRDGKTQPNFAAVKRDHPEGLRTAIQNSARSQKIASRGFIPNFAVGEDTAPADLSASVAAIVTQLGFVAFALSGFGNQYKQSLRELTESNIRTAKNNLRAARAANESKEVRQQLSQRVRAAQAGGLGQKLGAGITAGGAGLAIGAPIIAETIANAIGRETREARIGSASASALGQVGTFAGTGALIAGPKGAAVGALIGALSGLTGVIKELNTNVPELSAKAKESASKLTQFNEASQRTKTAFEQVQELSGRGQAVEAGKAQQELLKNIGKDFAGNPQLQAQAISSVINKDFTALQQALDKNTEALIKLDQQEQKNLAAQQFIEKTRGIGTLSIDTATAVGVGSFTPVSAEKQYSEEDLKQIRESFEENIKPFSPLSDPRYDTGLTPDTNENRKLLDKFDKFIIQTADLRGPEAVKFLEGKSGTPEQLKNMTQDQRGEFIDLVQPGLEKTQKDALMKMPARDFYIQYAKQAVEAVIKAKEQWSLVDQNTGTFNKEIQNILKNVNDVKSRFDQFAKSASFAVALQGEFNQALQNAKLALENAKLGNFETAATTLGDTDLARQFSIRSGLNTNENARDQSVNTAVQAIRQTLVDYLVKQGVEAKDAVRVTPIVSEDGAVGQGEKPLEVAQKAQEELEKLIDNLNAQLTGAKVSPDTLDPLKSVEENLNKIFSQLPNLDEKQQTQLRTELTPLLQNLTKETVLSNLLLKQQNAILAEQKVGEIMQEFIGATQKALGGTERFTGGDITFLNPLKEAVRDLNNLNKGVQGREIDIEKGRSSLTVLEEINKIVGRNIIPGLSPDNPIVGQAVGGLGLNIFDRLKEVFGLINMLPEGGEDFNKEILDALREQAGITEEEAAGIQSTKGLDGLIAEISKRFAQIQVGARDAENKILENVRNTAIERLEKTPGGEELAELLKSDFGKSISIEAQTVLELNAHTRLLGEIVELLRNPDTNPNSNASNSNTSNSGNSNFNLNSPAPTLSKGFIPSFAKEMNSVRRGVGGAKGSDYPLFVPNLNGDSAFINSGEKLIPNFANTGETAVLTRDMQKAMNMAEGFIPDFALWGGRSKNKKLNKIYQELQERAVRGDLRALAEAERMVAKQAFESKFTTTVFRGDDLPYTDYTSKLGRKGGGAGGGALGKGLYAASTERYADLFGAKASYPVGGGPPIDRWRQGNADIMSGVTRRFYTNANPVQLTDEVFNFADEFQKSFLAENKRLQGISSAAIDRNRQLLSIVPTPSNYVANFQDLPEVKAYNKYRDKVQEATNVAIRKKFSANAISATNYGILAQPGETEYALTRSNQLKLADTFTYDDKGKLIPLSKRFDTGPDVRGKVGQGLGKSIAKKLPLISIAAGLGFGASRAFSGDFLGAGLEVASGVAGTFPGPGTAGSIAIDAALFARDLEEISPNQKPLAEGFIPNFALGSDSLEKKLLERIYDPSTSREEKIKLNKTLQKFEGRRLPTTTIPTTEVAKTTQAVAAKGATKTILRALPGIGAILGLGEGAYRVFQGDYTGAALAAGAGLAGLKPGVGSGLSLALSAALIARDLQAAQDQIGADQSKPGSPTSLPQLSGIKSQNLDTILNAERTIRNITEGTKTFGATGFDLTNFDPAKIVDQYITNPEKLRFDDPETFDLIDKSVKSYLENPIKKPVDTLGKEIDKAFNAKDPESMKDWLDKLGLGQTEISTSLTNKDVWDRIADRNGGWDKAINNKKLPMAVRMGLWNRQERISSFGPTGTNIPRTGQVLTIGYINGSEQNPLGYRDAAIQNGAEFNADGRLKYPGKDMVREMNYVKPDGTVLTYKRVRGEPGKPMPLRLVSATRPPNQEYVTEGTNNDIIGVKNGNTTQYYSTADAPLGGLGEYKGQRIADNEGGAVIEDQQGNKVASIKSWQNDPAVQKAIATGNISEIEKATTRARDTAAANRGEIYGTPSVIDTIAGTPPKDKASQDFDNFLFEQKNKKYVDGVAADLVEPKPSEKPAPPPPPKKETTPEKIDEDIKNAKTKARGYIPSFTKEMRDISKGIGGARPTDTPLFIPNLNGGPAVINSGEKLIPNFAGSGETAVLTREMQKMMSFAKGFVPNFYQMGRTYSSRDKLFEINSGVDLMRGRRKLEINSGVDLMRGRRNPREMVMNPSDSRNRGMVMDPGVRYAPGTERNPGVRYAPGTERNPGVRYAPGITDFTSAIEKPGIDNFPGGAQKPGIDNFPGGAQKPGIDNFPGGAQKPGIDNFPDERGLVNNAWQRIARRYYDRNLLQSNMSFEEFLPLYQQYNSQENSDSYLTTRTASRGNNRLPMAIQMGLFNRAPSPLSTFIGSDGKPRTTGLGRSIPASNYTNFTRNDGRTLSYVNGRLSSVTRPQNEQYVTEGTTNDLVSRQRDNITEYYKTNDAMLGGLGSYAGRKVNPYQNIKTNNSGPILNSFIEDRFGKRVGSTRSFANDPAVKKAIAAGNISEIEKATGQARDTYYANRGQIYGSPSVLGEIAGTEKQLSPNISRLDSRIQESKEMLNRGDELLGNTPRYADTRSEEVQKIEAQKSFNDFLFQQSQKKYTKDGIAADLVDEEDKEKNYARGYIPNFAVDPAAITQAKLREKREAGPDSIPTFTLYQGKPMVYDAKTQTPSSAIQDHASEGGYEGVVKRQFGSSANKNIVANMAYNMKDNLQKSSNLSNNPTFNINFNPQTTFASQKGGDIPNFANITKKYDSMIQEMRDNMGVIWNKYNSLENLTSSNVRNGNLQNPPPRTQRTLKSII